MSLKRRVCIALLFNDGVLFRTKNFKPDYRYTQSCLGVDAVDEVFLIDITRDGPSKASWEAMSSYAEKCFSPTTFGGHIRELDDVKRFFDMGADKVVLGEVFIEKPAFITEIATKYGNQAATVALDIDQGSPVSARTGRKAPVSPLAYVAAAETYGAGEIFLQSKARDGSLSGYDVETLMEITSTLSIPVVVGTSCGHAGHMRDAFEAGASGCATGNIFHFTDGAIRGFKKLLAEYVRP